MNKTIHYIWIGDKEKTPLIKKCIKSWNKYLPDWTIIEWNEKNLNIDLCPFTKYYYENKKYAFVADVLRVHILYKYGGLYFDTDVELIKNIDDLLKESPFMCFENELGINPGLIQYFPEPNNNFLHDILNFYLNYNDFSSIYPPTINQIMTKELKKYGLSINNKIQTINGITIFPSDYFCPINATWKKQEFTINTRSIHHYSATWMPIKKQLEYKIKSIIHKIIRLDNQIKIVLIKRGIIWKN